MTSSSGPRPSGRPATNGNAPAAAAPQHRPSPRPEPEPEPDLPTEQVPIVDLPPGSPTQAVPVIGPFFDPPAPPRPATHRAPEPSTESTTEAVTEILSVVTPQVAPRREAEPETEAVPVVRRPPEPPTAAVKVIGPDLFTQHMPRPAVPPPSPPPAPPPAAPAPEPEAPAPAAAGADGPVAKRRLPVDISPGALLRTWRTAQPPRPMGRALLAALLVALVHVVTIVLGLVFVASAYGSYSLGTVLGSSTAGIACWLAGALLAVWVGVQARAGRLWAAIAFAVLAVVGLVITVQLALGTLTWIGLSGLPGVVRLVLLVLAALLCLAVPLLMLGPLRRGYFRRPVADS